MVVEGVDLVLEGTAAIVREEAKLRRVAEGYAAKYAGTPFQYTVRDGAFHGEGGESLLFELAPTRAFGYGRGKSFSATRWRF